MSVLSGNKTTQGQNVEGKMIFRKSNNKAGPSTGWVHAGVLGRGEYVKGAGGNFLLMLWENSLQTVPSLYTSARIRFQ